MVATGKCLDASCGRRTADREFWTMPTDATPHLQEALLRIQIEYVETPQLKLSARQVQRLWSLPNEVCQAALAALIRQGFLVQSPDGVYVRQCHSRERVERTASLA
jgi:hypothetical protein